MEYSGSSPNHKVIVKEEGERVSVCFEDTDFEHFCEWFVVDRSPENCENLVRCRGKDNKTFGPLHVSDGLSFVAGHTLLPSVKEIFLFCDKEGNVKNRREEDRRVVKIW
ncbi:hypothetical protein A9K97_gp185 [Tokyovirus A1]|uniref:hypothetical protein n=1 Tax=Tokyovirus A1 TaxID=1826170 RepID=UPI0007A97827|nr:hypothetical protein A9K97_gp185 [Tokyovirus A1]BAU80166.1 hypothetical protein [Tokyovirus A1]